jgi:hypothetical protein
MLLESVIDVWLNYRLLHNNNVPLTDMQYCIIKVHKIFEKVMEKFKYDNFKEIK